MQMKPRTLLSMLATMTSLLSGVATAWTLTAGFSSFTSESWRRADIEASPRQIPIATLEDHTGNRLALQTLCDRILVVDFIYTQCTTICRSLGAVSPQLTRLFAEQMLDAQVVSLSFDHETDTPERLNHFKRSMESVVTSWLLARPLNLNDRTALLQTFGIFVIPDGFGGYEHNGGLHIVHHCKLVKVLDPQDIDGALASVRALTEQEGY